MKRMPTAAGSHDRALQTAAASATAKAAGTTMAEKPKHKHDCTERRIISELHRHGIYW
ncbi:hypothetical protein ACRQ5Q_01405 [Bradyrhizobium sp. PMVTL-01]|uniref:hypothetical protein n=1 Tax=unclassified Bradyrhizobium TaxID=2631580 RepID=UPI003F727A07